MPYAFFTFESFDCSCSCDKASPAPTAACMGTATLPPVSYPLQRANATLAGLELCVICLLPCSLPALKAAFPRHYPKKLGSFFGSSCRPPPLPSALHSLGWVPLVTRIFSFSKAFLHLCRLMLCTALNVTRAARPLCPQQCCMLIQPATKHLWLGCGLLECLRLAAVTKVRPLHR